MDTTLLITNPYVAGNSVSGVQMFGREDVFRHLEQLWAPAGRVPSVLLHGSRRMGKTSILRHLGARFGPSVRIVDLAHAHVKIHTLRWRTTVRLGTKVLRSCREFFGYFCRALRPRASQTSPWGSPWHKKRSPQGEEAPFLC